MYNIKNQALYIIIIAKMLLEKYKSVHSSPFWSADSLATAFVTVMEFQVWYAEKSLRWD